MHGGSHKGVVGAGDYNLTGSVSTPQTRQLDSENSDDTTPETENWKWIRLASNSHCAWKTLDRSQRLTPGTWSKRVDN